MTSYYVLQQQFTKGLGLETQKEEEGMGSIDPLWIFGYKGVCIVQ